MQPAVVMAFRKRLKKHGYTDISIKTDKENGGYIVKAVEPLARVVVSCNYPLIGMHHAFR